MSRENVRLQNLNRDFPEDAEHFVVTHKEIVVTVGYDEEDPKYATGERVVKQRTGDRPDKVVYRFGVGDELPRSVATQVWSAFADRIAPLDANGHRMLSDGEGASGADPVAEWRDANL